MVLTSLSQLVASHLVARFPLAPTPGTDVTDLSPDAPTDLKTLVTKLLGLAAWAGTAAGVAGVLVTGAMMAISLKRGESSEHMSRLGLVLCGCILVSAAGPLVGFMFGEAKAEETP